MHERPLPEALKYSPLLAPMRDGAQAALCDTAVAGESAPSEPRPREEAHNALGAACSVAQVVPQAVFGEPVLVQRESPSALVTGPTGKHTSEPKKKTGLNPYLLERNKFMQSVKAMKGSTLTAAELAEASDRFRVFWRSMADKGALQAAYTDWRERLAATDDPQHVEYRPIWGGGCAATPITKEELHGFVKEAGWPTDEEVGDLRAQTTTAQMTEPVDFSSARSFDLWGVTRAARNVARTDANKTQFSCIERGFLNFLDDLGKSTVEAGDLMIALSGPNSEAPGTFRHFAALVTGLSLSRKVFEVTLLDFAQGLDAHSPRLPLPCKVVVASRPCRVSSNFQGIDCRT